jgi:DNA polymerase III subunit alpha
VPRWTESERLAREKEILGFFISGHPLEKYRDEVRVFEQVNTATLKQFRDQKVELACVVTGVSRQISKKNGSEWGRLTVEDFYGTASVLAFGDVWEQYHDLLTQDAPVLLRGSVSGSRPRRGRAADLPGQRAAAGQLRTSGTLAVEVALPPGGAEAVVAGGAGVPRQNPGQSAATCARSRTAATAAAAAATDGAPGAAETVRLRSRSIT